MNIPGTLTKQTQLNLLEHFVTLMPGIHVGREELRQVGWNWMTSSRAFALECESFEHHLSPKMNILIWNCRGAMKPSFWSSIRDLTKFHSRGIVVVTETRISGSRAGDILRSLPYDGIHTTDPIGYAGGIWLLWRKNMADLEVLATTEQEIHAIVKVNNFDHPWLLSLIYGSPRFAERKILWENLCFVSTLHNLPWAIVGDFNDVLNDSEKLKGNRVNMTRATAYCDCMSSCNMLDLGFSGPIYTWTNRRDANGLIQTRIDRCWANPSWAITYPEVNVTHLPRISSDHCPLLLSLSRIEHNKLQRPFRFEKMWLTHPGFPAIVDRAWDHAPSLAQAISSFTNYATAWNKEVFGNLFAQKKKNSSSSYRGLESHCNKALPLSSLS